MSESRNLGSILCPNCRKLISANAEQCVHCGTKNPNLWGFASVLRQLFGGQISLIPFISGVCIALYAISLLLDLPAVVSSLSRFGILGLGMPADWVVLKLGITGTIPVFRDQHWWTLITAVYLHGGILHIFFNVLWIRQLGPIVEEFYGISRAFLIFTISGIVGFVVSSVTGHAYTLGASGSIFGLLGALVYYGRKRGGTFGTAVYRQMGQWAVALFILGFVISRVDNFAHGGGFVGGYLSAMLFGFIEIRQENRKHQLLALGAIILTVLCFLLAVFS